MWVLARRSFVVRRMVLPAQRFLPTEGLGGGMLLLAALAALVWVNFLRGETYEAVFGTRLTFELGVFRLSEDLRGWINDGLMSIFFYGAGLEIKREQVKGALASPSRAALPVAAALGGMITPALIFAACNPVGPTARGWGIPMATDIAFAVGVIILAGKSAPRPSASCCWPWRSSTTSARSWSSRCSMPTGSRGRPWRSWAPCWGS